MSTKKKMLLAASGQAEDTSWTFDNVTKTFDYDVLNVNVTSDYFSLSDIFFKPDGTKIYVADSSTKGVYEYSLSTAWDITTATYQHSLDVSSHVPQQANGMFFKPDGTKMYFTTNSNKFTGVVEYSLSTAWDVTTGTYVQNFSIRSQEAYPTELFFKPDGTVLYVCGTQNDSVYQYALSTAWDTSTATYTQSFSVASEQPSPTSVFFKPDGTKMYVLGAYDNGVDEYTLSTAWDITTAVFVQNRVLSHSLNSSWSLFFKPDGTKMYVAERNSKSVLTISLSTAWDISTATWAAPTKNYLKVSAQETKPEGLFFKPDGTKMYTVGTDGDAVDEYSLSTAWDVTTGTYVQSFSVLTQQALVKDLFFKPDGTKMYILGGTVDEVDEYSLSTAWDVTTANYVQNFIISEDLSPTGMFFKSDGTKMFIVGTYNDSLYEYSLSTAWDLSTATWDAPSEDYFKFSDQTINTYHISFKSDGTKLYLLGYSDAKVNEYTLSTAWDITTATYLSSNVLTSPPLSTDSFFFKPDGTVLYIQGTNDIVASYTLSTAWDTSTAGSYVSSYSLKPEMSGSSDVTFSSDGTKMYAVDTSDSSIYSYTLSTAWDVSTASLPAHGSFNVQSTETGNSGIYVRDNDTTLFMSGINSDEVQQYDMNAVWDLSAGGTPTSSVSVQTNPQTVFFRPDGLGFFTCSYSNGRTVASYSVSPAWSLTSATFIAEFDVSNEDNFPRDVFFKPDGTKMYVAATEFDGIYEYSLSTAWDITTATYTQSFNTYAQESSLTGVTFKPDGTKMYTCGTSSRNMNEYSLSTAWDISTAVFVHAEKTKGGLGIAIKSDGTKIFQSSVSGYVHSFTLSTAWNLSTATFDAPANSYLNVTTESTTVLDIQFKSDGTKMYVLGRTTNNNLDYSLYEYSLSTAWDISTATYTQGFELEKQTTRPQSFFFKPDGTKFFIIDRQQKEVYAYTLSTAWDISTATYPEYGKFRPVSDGPRTLENVFFKPDGTKMYFAAWSTRSVYEFDLETEWDINSSTLVQQFNIIHEAHDVGGMFFKEDGNKMYVTNVTSGSVWSYKLS